MDAKVGDWVVTLRHGKPVEINALWYAALKTAANWAAELGDRAILDDYSFEANLVRQSFRAKFWNASRECLFDVVRDDAPVDKIRPNQIFAISLGGELLEQSRQQCVVRMVEREFRSRRRDCEPWIATIPNIAACTRAISFTATARIIAERYGRGCSGRSSTPI